MVFRPSMTTYQEAQHLGHRLRVDPEHRRRLASTHPLHVAGTPNPRIQIHSPALTRRVRAMLGHAYDGALALVHRRHAAIEALAAALVARRVLDGAEVGLIVGQHLAACAGSPGIAASPESVP